MMALAQSKCASLLSNMQVLAGLALVFVIARIAAQQTNLPNSKIIFKVIFIEMCHNFVDI